MNELLEQMKANAEAAALEDAANTPNKVVTPNPGVNDPSSTIEEDNAAVDAILGTQVVNAVTGKDDINKTIPTADIVEDKAPEEDVLETVWATRRGGGMTLNLEIPDEGQYLVNFEAGAVTLRGRAAKAMRAEYARNDAMRRLIVEVSANDKDTIMRLNKEAIGETQRGHRGVGSAAMGRREDAAHTMQQNRTKEIADITNKASGALTPLNP